MEIFFSAKNIGERGKGLTFNDVLLVPRHGDISSRRDPSLETKVTKNFSLKIPFISANMDTVTDQISFLDKEVRKLWAHRKGYLDNFKKQENKLNSNEKSIKNLKSQVTGVDDKLGSLSEKIQLAEDLQLKITLLTNELNKQKKVIEENEQALGAIDQYRIQNNQKITEVLNRLNNLSRELEDIESDLNALNPSGGNNE